MYLTVHGITDAITDSMTKTEGNLQAQELIRHEFNFNRLIVHYELHFDILH